MTDVDRCAAGNQHTRFEGAIDPVTGEWEIAGLGDCKYIVRVYLESSDITNGWTFSLGSPQQAVDLTSSDVVMLAVEVEPVGGIDLGSGIYIRFPNPDNDFEVTRAVSFLARDLATGADVRPKYAGNTADGGAKYQFWHAAALAPGTYTLRATSTLTKKTVWFDGTKNGTTVESQAKPIEVKLFWGEKTGDGFEFDLANPAPEKPKPEKPKPEKPKPEKPKPEKPKPAGPAFIDVPKGHKFFKEIAWMGSTGISTGVNTSKGKAYQPKGEVTREAMAAFLYRLKTPKGANAPVGYTVPKTSPFADVKPSDKFFKEIAWMHSAGISTGTKQAAGKPVYAPKQGVSREAMAAFMYRLEPRPGFKAPAKSPFGDIKVNHKFYKQIAWMKVSGTSTGTTQPQGLPHYKDKAVVSREAMAAFLYRS